jgi:L-ascorbate metabolism protein UlaG (beta-lactamase superfamily)
MRITWYGHAAFLVETQALRIILDPFRSPDSGGYEPIAERADVVAVSHENDRYHSHLGQIVPPFDVVRGLEIGAAGHEVRGIRFHAIRVFETPEKKAEDEVTILHFRSEELHVVHLGDLGHSLSEGEVAPLRGADVLFASAGGPPTIDYPEIPPLINAIDPRIIVPMHYKTPRINLNIQPVERFFEVLPEWPVERANATSFEVTSDTLPASRRIVWLDHAR